MATNKKKLYCYASSHVQKLYFSLHLTLVTLSLTMDVKVSLIKYSHEIRCLVWVNSKLYLEFKEYQRVTHSPENILLVMFMTISDVMQPQMWLPCRRAQIITQQRHIMNFVVNVWNSGFLFSSGLDHLTLCFETHLFPTFWRYSEVLDGCSFWYKGRTVNGIYILVCKVCLVYMVWGLSDFLNCVQQWPAAWITNFPLEPFNGGASICD